MTDRQPLTSGPNPKEERQKGRRSWRFADWLYGANDAVSAAFYLFRLLQPLIILLIAFLFMAVILRPAPWSYAIDVRSQTAVVFPSPRLDTEWRVDGGTVCTRSRSAESSSEENNLCGSSRWRLVEAGGPEAVIIMRSIAGTLPEKTNTDDSTGSRNEHPYSARFDWTPEGAMVLRLTPNHPSARLTLARPDGTETHLDEATTVTFPRSGSPSRLVFPFTGETLIGDDARAGSTSILQSGQLSIFSQTDETITGRAEVDSVRFLPGDRLHLKAGERSIPRGFLYVETGNSESNESSDSSRDAMTIVAFGHAESLRVIRYGEAGIVFRPSLWAELTRPRPANTLIGMLLGALGLMVLYQGAAKVGSRRAAKRLFRRRPPTD